MRQLDRSAVMLALAASLPLLDTSPRAATELVNPVTLETERVTVVETGAGLEVAWQVLTDGVSWSEPYHVSDNAVDDFEPQLCVDPATGDSSVVYWRDSGDPTVHLRTRRASDGTWRPEAVISVSEWPGRSPSCAYFSGFPVYSYESSDGASGVIVTGYYNNLCPGENCPFPPRLLPDVPLAFSPRTRVHAAGDDLWIDWIDAVGVMGYSVYDPALHDWSRVELMAIADGVDATRDAIAAIVTEGQ